MIVFGSVKVRVVPWSVFFCPRITLMTRIQMLIDLNEYDRLTALGADGLKKYSGYLNVWSRRLPEGMHMLGETEIRNAVDIQKKTYRLLKWLEGAMSQEFISPASAHNRLSESDVTRVWIRTHVENLPVEARPNVANEDEFNDFCNFFTSYLLTSFDLNPQPGQRLYSEGGHCFCPMCSYLVNVPHLLPKKISRQDRHKAVKMKRNALVQLCMEAGLSIPRDNFEEVIESEGTRESVALVAYGHQLILRVLGETKGVGALVLWREIAWDGRGRPKAKFELTADMILSAKDALITALRS